MGRSPSSTAAAMAALCFFALAGVALAGVALADPKFTIQGRVYCDTCRAGFETSLTTYMPGAKVRLECKHFSTGVIEFQADGVTDGTGTFKIEVTRSHEEDICEVALLKSADEKCSEIDKGRDRARVVLSSESGLATQVRYANSLGFLRDEPLGDCGLLLQMYALGTDK